MSYQLEPFGRSWLYLSIPGLVLFPLLLLVSIRHVTRLRMFSVFEERPFVPSQDLTLPDAGTYTLWVEQPSMSFKVIPLRHLRALLIDPQTGRPVPDRMSPPLRASRSFSRRRWALRTFAVERGGLYTLRFEGLKPDRDYAECSIAIGPGATSGAVFGFVAAVLAIIACTFGLLGSILVTVFALAGTKVERVEQPAARWEGSGTTAVTGDRTAGRRLGPPAEVAPGWGTVDWREGGLSFRVPPGWVERSRSDRDVDWRSPDAQSAFIIIRISDYPIEAPTDQIVAAQVLAADAQVRGGSLDGYEVREIGGRSGLLSLRTSREGQLREVFWTTVVGTSGRYRSVDLNAGAFDGNFERLEADLAAILTSLRFPAEAADPHR
jgi:hypothetical protein